MKKSNDKRFITFCLRMDQQLYGQVRQLAFNQNKSIAGFIREYLHEALYEESKVKSGVGIGEIPAVEEQRSISHSEAI